MNAVASKKKKEDKSGFFGVPNAPGTTNTPGDWAVNDDRWLKEKQHWTDTAVGKAGIEFVSRITLGGIFYSLMENSETMSKVLTYRRSKHEEKKQNGETSILENIAYFLDSTVGRGMYKLVDSLWYRGAIARDSDGEVLRDDDNQVVTKARQFMRFRENRNLHTNQKFPGRSLGAEMTIVTASFAAMSAGSAIMRNLLSGILNPKERKSWTKDGEFDPVHIAKKVTGKVWEIGTYNAGEDMAVALPYVLFMRGQRNLLDKIFFPGFRFSSDGVDNGGGIRINKDGKVVGHMLWAGAADLQGRFTVYNVFTQLYRDVYDNIGRSIKQWWSGGKQFEAPDWARNPTLIPGMLVKNTKQLVRYTTVSAIRSILQMTPAVPFFSILRVPGSKVNGMAVHQEHGSLQFVREDGKLGAAVRANLGGFYYGEDFVGHDKRYNYLSKNQLENLPEMAFADGTPFTKRAAFFYRYNNDKTGPHPTKAFDPHGYGNKGRELHSSVTMRASDWVAKRMHKIAENKGAFKLMDPLFNGIEKLGYKPSKRATEDREFVHKRIAKDALMAGMPYASYFAAKVLTRESYVNEQMNMAVERLLDGLLSFSGKEISAGMSEISSTIMRQPLEDPERQAKLIESHIEDPSDRSPRPVDWNADLHRKALDRRMAGKEIDKANIITKLNQERSDHYANRIKERAATKEALRKGEFDNWTEKQATSSEVENTTHLS